MKARIEIDQEYCKGCGMCITYCPKNLIKYSDTFNDSGYIPAEFKNNDECTGCAICAMVCPEVAIEVYRG
jgi:2-oxoglutarate ferredoxin oxidoreductase subunit delta